MVSVRREEHAKRGWLSLAIALCVLSALPLTAAAQTVTGAARVTTSVDACVPIEIEQFQRVLAIELGTSIEFAPDAAKAPDGTAIHVTCSGAGIELQLSDTLTRKSMQRVVDLPQVAVAARTRLLALAVAEFVGASWVELQLTPSETRQLGPPVSPEAAKQVSRAVRARLPSEPRYEMRWLIGLSLEPTLFSRGGGLLGQVSLHLQQRPIAHLAIGLSASVAHGDWDISWASVRVQQPSARLTTTTGRLSLGYVTSYGPVELLAAAAVRFGMVHMAGVSYGEDLRAGEMIAPWGGPAVQLSAAGHWDHLRVGLELELGYVALPVQATIDDARVIAELGGAWGSLSLVAGWLF